MPGGGLEPVSLRDAEPLDEGRFRRVFVHPADATKCIKIDRINSSTASRSPLRFGKKDLSGNEREIQQYKRFIADKVPYERYFPRYYGVIDTDLGPGLCVELLKGTDSKPPMMLERCINMGMLEDKNFADYAIEEYEKFALFCEQYSILTASAGFENVGIVTVDGATKLVSFDVKSTTSKQLIPLADWFNTLKKARVRRRFAKRLAMLRTAAASGVQQSGPRFIIGDSAQPASESMLI